MCDSRLINIAVLSIESSRAESLSLDAFIDEFGQSINQSINQYVFSAPSTQVRADPALQMSSQYTYS